MLQFRDDLHKGSTNNCNNKSMNNYNIFTLTDLRPIVGGGILDNHGHDIIMQFK